MWCNMVRMPQRTHMGRARAWLRVALMQKKLADYIKLLVDNRDTVLTEYFEPDALMMSEEAVVIVGLLGGLNVIDCNLCIKEEDLDHERGVIDFSLYLRSNYHNNNSPETPESDLEYDNMSTVLDQKNYIEELNRHLNSTVANLQSRVEQLTTTNALMKEDLEISRTNMVALMQENTVLKAQRNQNKNMKFKHRETVCISEEKRKSAVFDDEGTKDMDLLKHQLMNERKLREEAEGELIDQTCHSSQLESTVSMLEKDIHEKQEIIISLRKQLEDIKTINLEMYRKLQECEEELTQKAEVVTRLQAKTLQIGQMLNNLQKFNHILTDDNIQRKTTIPRYGKALVPVKETTKMSKMDLNSHFNDKEKQQEKPYDVSPAFAVVKTEDESSTEIKQHEQLVDELVTNEDSSEINIEEKQENRQQEKSCVTNESDTLLDEE